MACAMVFPVSSSRVKNTAPMIGRDDQADVADLLGERELEFALALGFGLVVEFAKSASMDCATPSAWPGSATLTMYQPTVPWLNGAASSKYS